MTTDGAPVAGLPEKTPEALRNAVIRLAPDALATFDSHWAETADKMRDERSLLPGRHFIEHWWTWVAVARHPERLARMRRCEYIVAHSEDRAERREAAAEISQILAAASHLPPHSGA
ncbi:DUF6247 family protein [Nocardiopsis sp. RSe5-2]|uniref:DUF6247 family protein n=1 Tax=Nocardiopsis endophytica TaxID=3018445 RepID=A0ABT4UAT8_9ACTN|nr:DUF6247 family protein [Nocardiopsis endophytica]MDA2813447.1 DUF6247 family protein [Nocardiopsis endophytica]